jgi:hypothetical protein
MPLTKIKGSILDAQFHETLQDELSNDVYSNCVVLVIQDEESRRVFISALSEPDIRAVAGTKSTLSSRDMITFASELRERVTPVTVLVNPETDEITPEMLQAAAAMDDEPEAANDDDEGSAPIAATKPRTPRVPGASKKFGKKDK